MLYIQSNWVWAILHRKNWKKPKSMDECVYMYDY